jgi:hypothetical protein
MKEAQEINKIEDLACSGLEACCSRAVNHSRAKGKEQKCLVCFLLQLAAGQSHAP